MLISLTVFLRERGCDAVRALKIPTVLFHKFPPLLHSFLFPPRFLLCFSGLTGSPTSYPLNSTERPLSYSREWDTSWVVKRVPPGAAPHSHASLNKWSGGGQAPKTRTLEKGRALDWSREGSPWRATLRGWTHRENGS